MGKVAIPDNLASVSSFEELRRFVAVALSNIAREINGGIAFTQNINSAGPYTITFTGSGTVTKITHNLNQQPTGFILVDANADVRIWRPSTSGTEWTANTAFLTASGAATVKVYII